MSKFSIDTSQINSIPIEWAFDSFSLFLMGNSLNAMSNDVDFGTRQDADIQEAMRSIANRVKKSATTVSALSDGLSQINRSYTSTETMIIMANRIGDLLKYVSNWLDRKSIIDTIISTTGIGVAISTATAIGGATKSKAKIGDKEYDHEGTVVWDPEKGEWVKKEDGGKDPKWDVTIYGKEWKTSDSVWSGEYYVEEDGVEASMKLDLWKTTAKAGAYVGTAGIGAYAGASITALHFEDEVKVGGENLNAYAKGEVDIGRVGAEAKGKIGFDEDGKFNAGAGFSAEAIAGEASVKGGVNVAGVDVSGKVSVNYGVGVKGNIGYSDGKFKVELGATLGVGIGVDFEVDVSKAVDTIVDVGGAIVDGAVSAIDTVGDAIGSGISAIGDVLFGWW